MTNKSWSRISYIIGLSFFADRKTVNVAFDPKPVSLESRQIL